MAEVQPRAEIVIDADGLERYVREAKVTALGGALYVVVLGGYAALRVFLDVPYLRAALGLYVAASLVVIVLKRRIHRVRLVWLVLSASLATAGNGLILVLLTGRNRGTLFAEAAALLAAITLNHVLDRVVARRA